MNLLQASPRVIVRKTFIEVVDDHARIGNSPGVRRSASDAALYDRFASVSGDTHEENEHHQLDYSFLGSIQTSYKMVAAKANTDLDSQRTASTASSDCEVVPSEDLELEISSVLSVETGSWHSNDSSLICSLLAENARLAAENKLLRDGICLGEESAIPAQASTVSGLSTAFDEAALYQMPCLPLQPGWDVVAACHASDGFVAGVEQTTLMWRNLPNNYTREMLLALFDGAGFSGLYNFVYLPVDFKAGACLGYAFINLVSPSLVSAFWSTFDGFSQWAIPSKKVSSVSWCPTQGLAANIQRYRDSPVMHHTVPDAYKPVIFAKGLRVKFPAPTKAPRAPRVVRKSKSNCREPNE